MSDTGGRRDFADLLLDLRVQAGLSQEELADRAGLSVRSIREIDATRCEMGIEFVGVTAEQYEQLDTYLHLRGD